jgi:predicted transcriptional regulator
MIEVTVTISINQDQYAVLQELAESLKSTPLQVAGEILEHELTQLEFQRDARIEREGK